MTFLVQLLMLAYAGALIAAAVAGDGPLHSSGVSIAMTIAVVAVVRQLAILLFSFLQGRRTRRLAPEGETVAPTMMPWVSIIVPAWNEERVIEQSLRSMLALDYPKFEILFVDDGSTDRTYTIAESLVSESSGRLRVFRQANAGKSQALNLGLRISRHPFVLCVDADSTIEPGGLAAALRHFRDPRVAAVAGVVQVRLGRGRWLARLQRTEYLMSQRLTRAAIAFFRCVTVVPGPAGLFRRAAVIEAGGYLSAADCFAEDAELTIRLLADDHDIVAEPALISVTEAPATLFALLRQRYRWSRGSVQALFLNARPLLFGRAKRGPALFLFLLAETIFLPTLCFGVALFFLAATLAHGDVGAFALGLLVLVALEMAGLVMVSGSWRHLPIYLIEYLAIRFFYAYVLTAWTLMCLRDEMSAVGMSWDKLERQGGEP